MDPVIKLEIGKQYKARDGTIFRINGQSGELYGDVHPYDFWRRDGRVSNLVTCNLDLIEEVDVLRDAKEVNRFTFYVDDKTVRITVYQDLCGGYHINEEKTIDHLVTTRKDIHGTMDHAAYINWLTNTLFSISYMRAKEIDKKWMLYNDK